MDLNFNWISLVVLFGAIQGLIFSVILFFNRRHPGAVFLGMIMLIIAYNGIETFNWTSGLDQHIIFFDLFSFILIYAIGPSLYLYVSVLLHPDKPVTFRQIAIHYAVVAFQFIYRVVFVVLYYLWKFYDVEIEFAGDMLAFFWLYAEPLSVLVFLGYLVATIRLFRKVRRTSPIKPTQEVSFKWIRALLICMTVLGIAWPITVLTPYFLDIPFGPHYYPIEVALVLFIYWIAFVGYHKTRTIYLKNLKGLSNNLSVSAAKEFMNRLRQVMDEHRVYLDPALNLEKVSAHTGLPAKVISATLNQHFHCSFNDFINTYRVRTVQERLTDRNYQHLTISGIALESGFNSQATFQRAFKNATGVSPREYLNNRAEKEKGSLKMEV